MKTKFYIKQMDCPEEVKMIKGKFKKIEEISKTKFDTLNHILEVEHDNIESDIYKAIKSLGFTPQVVNEKVTGENVECESCRIANNPSNKEEEPIQTDTFKKRIIDLLPLIGSFILFIVGLIVHLNLEREYIALGFYLSSAVIGGYKIYIKAFYGLKQLNFSMNVLMTVAIIGAFIIGEYIEATIIVMLFAVSHKIEDYTVDRARQSINKLMDLKPKTARVISENETIDKLVEEVKVDSIILVRPSERIPLDGEIIEGNAEIDQSPITGESRPISKESGDEVFAGTINLNGIIKIKVTTEFENTVLKKIIYMVEQATSKKTKLENFINRFSGIYTPIIMSACFLIAVIPPLIFGGVWQEWIYRALTILLIGCPCAFVISTPVTIIGGITMASRNGILVKGGIYLEKFDEIKNLAFDKTGTLTYGKMKVEDIILLNNKGKEELFNIAYLLEENSEHPIGKAIVSYISELGISRNGKSLENFNVLKGKGIEGYIDGEKYYLGSHRFFHDLGLCGKENHQSILKKEREGKSIVMIGDENELIGAISISDRLREGIDKSIQKLKGDGVENIIMLTGDNKETAKAIAEESHIDIYHPELLPDDKVRKVKEYNKISMVGDGINDAPAMAVSDVGIAMGGGTDVSIETADIVLMKNDISKISTLKKISRKTIRLIKQNVFAALGLKAVFLILALLGIATLWMAVIADVGASIMVILNGLRILRNNEKSE
jgi:Cd2+/Zn2+-exporting ATPase